MTPPEVRRSSPLLAVFGGLVVLAAILVGAIFLGGRGGPTVSASEQPSAASLQPITDVPTPGCEDVAGQPPIITATPLPTVEHDVPFEVIVHGRDYEDLSKADTDEILDRGCAITAVAHKPDGDMILYYRLPEGLIPPGAVIKRIDAKICGPVMGEFWEVYGPLRSTPIEYEVTQPDDGECWSFEKGSGLETDVSLYLSGDTTWRIEEVRYTVTLH